ncbi:MAG: glucose-6-phosphate isomerase [Betaproteobacteria bacterium]|nr:glucose-6-phosphate isomerase [Betaproteobacteria bacterium]
MATSLTKLPAWQDLERHRRAVSGTHLRQLFDQDPERFGRFSLRLDGMLLDFSKQLVTKETMRLLVALARECRLEGSIRSLLAGERVNFTENRAALHFALRAERPVLLDGRDVTRDVAAVLAKLRAFSEGVRSGEIKGASGQHFTDIVNIGIGGSDLGPALACEALAPYAIPTLNIHFASNADGHAIAAVLGRLDPGRTLFIVASKTFTTQETLANASTARDWVAAKLGIGAAAAHFCAVTAAPERAAEFGIAAQRVFEIWDWVGGRYSLWSAIGLPVALAVGMDHFDALRAGARAMDEHFATAPLERNMPVAMGLLTVWYADFHGTASTAVLPYDERLRLLPAYLQQLEMESCGKRTTRDGGVTDYATAPVRWGTTGTNGQHAYFQLLHQGTHVVPADFIACCEPHHRLPAHHDILLAHFFAQTEALMRGRTEKEAEGEMRADGLDPEEIRRLLPHRTFPGSRPSTSILLRKLDPGTLGALIALYEHKVFVESVIWNVNAFDQWGVELGKRLADRVLAELADADPVSGHDSSTNGLINHLKAVR